MTRLAVLGSPIRHSLSPALHAAAYRELGLDWEYEAIEVTSDTLEEFISSRDDSWRGLSLTMPLKREVLDMIDQVDPLVELTGSANTLLFHELGGARHTLGFNTDVYGITQSFQLAGHSALHSVLILGGGATAASAIAAVNRLSARRVYVAVRNPDRAAALVAVGERHGTEVVVVPLDLAPGLAHEVDAVISTLPNGAAHDISFAVDDMRSAVLFDVAYDPWPSTLASQWIAAGGDVIPGIDMLVHQALIQVRVFVHGTPDMLLDNESAVLTAMRASLDA
jgi:shikimate dehydrogenase